MGVKKNTDSDMLIVPKGELHIAPCRDFCVQPQVPDIDPSLPTPDQAQEFLVKMLAAGKELRAAGEITCNGKKMFGDLCRYACQHKAGKQLMMIKCNKPNCSFLPCVLIRGGHGIANEIAHGVMGTNPGMEQ